MPMVDGWVDGYYKVKSLTFKNDEVINENGEKTQRTLLHLSLGELIRLGDDKVFFYKVKMTAGQLHSISKIEEDYEI